MLCNVIQRNVLPVVGSDIRKNLLDAVVVFTLFRLKLQVVLCQQKIFRQYMKNLVKYAADVQFVPVIFA